jgi:imidazolonepropionase-like amidohydrolase
MALTLFQNATLFDGTSPESPEGMFILVEDRLIKEVSDRPITASNARVIDCAGKTLMPGMIDAHIHVYIASPKLISYPPAPMTYVAHYGAQFMRHALACGFTTLRDVAGGDHGLAMALRDGFLSGPRFYYGGLAMSQTGGHGDFRSPDVPTDFCACGAEYQGFCILADGVDECRKVAREELRKGAHHIKIMGSGGVLSPSDPLQYPQYSEEEIRAIVEECERQGKYTAAHCHPDEAIRRCIEYGVRSIEHGTLITEETAELVAQKQAFVVPTMATIYALKELGPQQGIPEVSMQKLDSVVDHAMNGLEIMQRAGVQMGFGTDLLGDMHNRQCTEFTIRSEVLEPIDILRSATSVNAKLLGQEGMLGCITAGAFADILVVDGNPLENIELLAANGEKLSVIMADGALIKY